MGGGDAFDIGEILHRHGQTMERPQRHMGCAHGIGLAGLLHQLIGWPQGDNGVEIRVHRRNPRQGTLHQCRGCQTAIMQLRQ